MKTSTFLLVVLAIALNLLLLGLSVYGSISSSDPMARSVYIVLMILIVVGMIGSEMKDACGKKHPEGFAEVGSLKACKACQAACHGNIACFDKCAHSPACTEGYEGFAEAGSLKACQACQDACGQNIACFDKCAHSPACGGKERFEQTETPFGTCFDGCAKDYALCWAPNSTNPAANAFCQSTLNSCLSGCCATDGPFPKGNPFCPPQEHMEYFSSGGSLQACQACEDKCGSNMNNPATVKCFDACANSPACGGRESFDYPLPPLPPPPSPCTSSCYAQGTMCLNTCASQVMPGHTFPPTYQECQQRCSGPQQTCLNHCIGK
jgi:hypothetical protein